MDNTTKQQLEDMLEKLETVIACACSIEDNLMHDHSNYELQSNFSNLVIDKLYIAKESIIEFIEEMEA